MSKSENELIDAVCGLLDFTNQDVLTENARGSRTPDPLLVRQML